MSGVLGNISAKVKESQPSMSQDQSDNWFLSRSAPNSLNNGFNSLEIRISKHSNILEETAEERSSLVPLNTKNPTTSNVGRVMYLPECKENDLYEKEAVEIPQHLPQKKKEFKTHQNGFEDINIDTNLSKINYRITSMSKSCENISSGGGIKSSFEPEDLQVDIFNVLDFFAVIQVFCRTRHHWQKRLNGREENQRDSLFRAL